MPHSLATPRTPRPSPASAASLGEWDIIGIGSRDVVLVQVKTVKGGVKLDHFGGAKVDQLVKG